MKPAQILNQQMRFYRSFNSITMTASRIAAAKVQRNNLRNHLNSQSIYTSAAMRAFASKLTRFTTHIYLGNCSPATEKHLPAFKTS
jgi:hypothetical protein